MAVSTLSPPPLLSSDHPQGPDGSFAHSVDTDTLDASNLYATQPQALTDRNIGVAEHFTASRQLPVREALNRDTRR